MTREDELPKPQSVDHRPWGKPAVQAGIPGQHHQNMRRGGYVDAMDKVCLWAEERLELEEHVMDDARHVVLVLWWEHAPRPVPGRECRQSVSGLKVHKTWTLSR